MLMVRAPFRVSLFGGGSDHPNFIDKHGYGFVVSAAINKYCYVSVKELMSFFPYRSKITYSEVETFNSLREIRHRVFKNCLQYCEFNNDNVEVNYTADLPGSIGLGTSSTMIVCMLEALHQYKYNKSWPDHLRLWGAASYVEQVMMGETVGYQDFLPAIHGWIKGYRITHHKVDKVYITNNIPTIIDQYGLLFYLGKTRNSSSTLSSYIDKIPDSDAQLEIRNIAERAIKEDDPRKLGDFMTQSWQLKRSLSPAVSNEVVDEFIDTVLQNGAYGARLCGGGNGGCVFVLADPGHAYNIKEAAREFGAIEIPFQLATKGVERIL